MARRSASRSPSSAPEARRPPSPEELRAAAGRRIPDVIATGLRVLFCGINPGLYSGAVGHHFARPGNRFWKALHGAGFTPRLLSGFDDRSLPALGLGITNICARTSARAEELSAAELVAGGRALERKALRHGPRVVAVLGIGAYRLAFGRPEAAPGRQDERLGDAGLWVLPNPSGLNAHYSLPALVRAFRELRDAVDGG